MCVFKWIFCEKCRMQQRRNQLKAENSHFEDTHRLFKDFGLNITILGVMTTISPKSVGIYLWTTRNTVQVCKKRFNDSKLFKDISTVFLVKSSIYPATECALAFYLHFTPICSKFCSTKTETGVKFFCGNLLTIIVYL